MGVKSTKFMTREQAEQKYLDLAIANIRASLALQMMRVSDGQLETILEALNDAVNEGEGFENYIINETGVDT